METSTLLGGLALAIWWMQQKRIWIGSIYKKLLLPTSGGVFTAGILHARKSIIL